MSLIAMTNVLSNNIWQSRFHADPMVRSAELLLHERIPRRLVVQEAQDLRPDEAMPEADTERPSVRELDTPDTAQPHIALLGHVPYTIMVSHCGAGYSRYEELAVSRWQSDGTRDFTGQFCYLKDLSTGRIWSAAHQPVCAAGRQLPGAAGDRPGDLPPDRWLDRDQHRDRSGAGGRGRSSAGHRHQPQR